MILDKLELQARLGLQVKQAIREPQGQQEKPELLARLARQAPQATQALQVKQEQLERLDLLLGLFQQHPTTTEFLTT